MFSAAQILVTLVSIIAPGAGSPGDLCDIVSPRTGTPLRCEPHYEGAPFYDDLACCDDENCWPALGRDCNEHEQRHYCELGEVDASGELRCYFEVPSYCDIYPCEPHIGVSPQAEYMCCHGMNCWPMLHEECFMEAIMWCEYGTTNTDGSITCYD